MQRNIIIGSVVACAVVVAIIVAAVYYRHSIILKFKNATSSRRAHFSPDILDFLGDDTTTINITSEAENEFWNSSAFSVVSSSKFEPQSLPNPYALDITSDVTSDVTSSATSDVTNLSITSLYQVLLSLSLMITPLLSSSLAYFCNVTVYCIGSGNTNYCTLLFAP